MTIEETIDAFVDGEIVGAGALDAALALPEGRAYLCDVLALRRLMHTESVSIQIPSGRRAHPFLKYASAAALALTLVGLGYAAGLRQVPAPALTVSNTNDTARPPEPTRVIELTPGVNWHESKGGD